jgi:hypothetical protein
MFHLSSIFCGINSTSNDVEAAQSKSVITKKSAFLQNAIVTTAVMETRMQKAAQYDLNGFNTNRTYVLSEITLLLEHLQHQ